MIATHSRHRPMYSSATTTTSHIGASDRGASAQPRAERALGRAVCSASAPARATTSSPIRRRRVAEHRTTGRQATGLSAVAVTTRHHRMVARAAVTPAHRRGMSPVSRMMDARLPLPVTATARNQRRSPRGRATRPMAVSAATHRATTHRAGLAQVPVTLTLCHSTAYTTTSSRPQEASGCLQLSCNETSQGLVCRQTLRTRSMLVEPLPLHSWPMAAPSLRMRGPG